MSVDRNGLWALLIGCAVVGVATTVRAELRAGRDEPKLKRVGRHVDAVLTGVGYGFLAAFVVLLLASLMASLR